MKNWKTTLSGALGVLPYALKYFGCDIPNDVLDAIGILATFAVGFFASDIKQKNDSLTKLK